MPAIKVSVSLDEKDLRWLRSQAKRRRKSLSSVLTESVQQARRDRALDEVLAWLEAPKLTLEQLDDLRRQWGAD
jgi:hypothetical protein